MIANPLPAQEISSAAGFHEQCDERSGERLGVVSRGTRSQPGRRGIEPASEAMTGAGAAGNLFLHRLEQFRHEHRTAG